jgi:carbon-monoxide dehydrogenase large subunit
VEDQRFITGTGRYTDDISLDGQAYGVAVRSPEAHATINSIEIEAATAAPGVLAVILADDVTAHGSNELPCAIPMENRDGSAGITPLRPVLCKDRVRHVGDHVAFVVAETAAQAKDAAELVMVDYGSLDAVTRTASAAGQASRWSMTTCPATSPSTGSSAIAPAPRARCRRPPM